ncbi:MAG: cofactor-independent phosphoglycerate mutase [Eubacteriales bacterium]|nr:cofactor-independent phosphoglycerate mutase [Eubacteriales bacterium]
MKWIVVLGDGMADRPLAALDGKTPLQAANKPYMDYIAQHGTVGMARTIPEGMPPGSDAANMSVMGYAPAVYYTGRSPLEAVSLGVEMAPDDVAIRCNLVCLSDAERYEDKTMEDYSAGELETEDAVALIRFLQENMQEEDLRLFPGISYRHCLLLHHAQLGTQLTPPHDISGRRIGDYLPKGRYGERLDAFMRRSYALLKEHPVNQARIAAGKKPANSCWFWGEGTRPAFKSFAEIYGKKAAVVCAVDLIKGLGICAGMYAPHIPGATGAKRTDFAAKGRAALSLLNEGYELVYIHVEAPDESGHAGDIACKVEAIEAIDRDVLGLIMEGLRAQKEPFAVLLTPDHPTPIEIRTHSADPVPFVLYRSDLDTAPGALHYTEADAAATGLYLAEGPLLMRKLVDLDF